jgi:hypothetical protein
MDSTSCSDCGNLFADSVERVPCPKCGGAKRTFSVFVCEKVNLREFIGYRIVNTSVRKEPLVEHIHRLELQVSTGRMVEKSRTIDRRADEYYEEVIDDLTRKVIHSVREPLSTHKGHGSAKKKKG